MSGNHTMRQSRTIFALPLGFAVLAASHLVSVGVVAQDAAPVAVEATALDAPTARAEGAAAVDDAVAAAVIGAITTHFDDAQVRVKLDRVSVDPLSLRDRTVSGEGRLRIGDDPAWIPIHFDALYDTYSAQASQPSLVLGTDVSAEAAVAVGPSVAIDLADRMTAALDAEFPDQPVSWSSDQITAVPATARFLKVEAVGTADFDAEGRTRTTVQALYDRESGEWLGLDYELGASANHAAEVDLDPAIASR